jgi:hypothetical protein
VRVVAVYDLRWYWTLTLSTNACTAEESDRYVMASWARLRRALWRRYGAFAYVGIPEVTQRGYVHLNLYASVHITEADLSALWHTASHGSNRVAVRPVYSNRLALYLMKQLKGCLSVPSERGGWWFSSQGIHLGDFIPATRAPVRDQPGFPQSVKPLRVNRPPAREERPLKAVSDQAAAAPVGGLPTARAQPPPGPGPSAARYAPVLASEPEPPCKTQGAYRMTAGEYVAARGLPDLKGPGRLLRLALARDEAAERPPPPPEPPRTHRDILALLPLAPCGGGCGTMQPNGWTCLACRAQPP